MLFAFLSSLSLIYISDLQVCNGNKNKTLTICQRLQMKAPLRKADSFGI